MDKEDTRYLFLGAVVIGLFLTATQLHAQEKSITFVNQAQEPATVKLTGPTSRPVRIPVVRIPVGAKQIRKVLPGRYKIRMKYGTEGGFRLVEGEDFTITNAAGTQSETTITLHGIVSDNDKPYTISRGTMGGPLQVHSGGAKEQTNKKQVINITVPDGWMRMSNPPQGFEMGLVKSIGARHGEFFIRHENISLDEFDYKNTDVRQRWDEAVRKEYSLIKKLRSSKPEVNGQLLTRAAYDLTNESTVTRRLYTYILSNQTTFETQLNAPRENWKDIYLDFKKMIASLSMITVATNNDQSGERIEPLLSSSEEEVREAAATKRDGSERFIEPLLLDGEVELRKAVRDGLVKVAGSGSGLCSVNVSLESRSKTALTVVVLPGTIFQPDSASTQSMVALREKKIKLTSDGDSELFSVAVACANMNRSTPGRDDSFKISTKGVPGDLLALLKLPEFHQASSRIQQFAVWTITDNPDRNGYVGIGSFGFGSGPTESDIRTIRQLFTHAGISLAKYRAFALFRRN